MMFQIFLLMLLALYIVGYVLVFAMLSFGGVGRPEEETFNLPQRLVISLLSWVGVAAFLVALADGVDESNGIKK